MQPWTSVGECRSTIVLPAVTHLEFVGRYRSAWGADFTSKVRMVPLGIRVQPSSALKSFLPVEARAVHVMVAGSSARQLASNRLEHRTLVAERRQHVLLRQERAVVGKPATADEKGVGARAAAQARCLEVKENKRWLRGCAAGEHRRMRGGAFVPCGEIADPNAATPRIRLDAALHHETA